jgi:hypothetical protein
MLKRLISTTVLALAVVSGLTLASCANKGGPPLDNRGDCARQTFPQCGLGGAH